jgi:hypothetical protein
MDTLGTGFSDLLTRAALWALAAAAVWAIVVVAAIAAEAWTDGRVRIAQHLGCPVAWRASLLAVFLVLFAGFSTAQAADRDAAGEPSAPVAGSALDGLPLPDRPAGRPVGDPAAVVVRSGDSLWRIARRHLPANAADAVVAAAVKDLYLRNRLTIGPDPDRLEPGQRLVLPTHLAEVPPTHLEER